MSEQTNEKQIERAEAALSANLAESRHRLRIGSSPLAWGLAGAILGSVAVYAIAQMSPARQPIAINPSTKASGAAQEPGIALPEPTSPTVKASPEGDPPRGPLTESFPAGTSPVIPGGVPPRGLTGSISAIRLPDDGSPLPDVDRTTRGAQVLSDKPGEAKLLSVVHATDDADTARAALAARAKKLGGKSKTLPRSKTTGSLGGLIVYVPAEKAKQMVDYGAEIGAVVAQTTWTGDFTKRHAKLEEDAQAYLFELQKQRQELIARYFEDAPAVVEIDDKIKEVTAQLNEIRREKGTDAMAAIRFEFVQRG